MLVEDFAFVMTLPLTASVVIYTLILHRGHPRAVRWVALGFATVTTSLFYLLGWLQGHFTPVQIYQSVSLFWASPSWILQTVAIVHWATAPLAVVLLLVATRGLIKEHKASSNTHVARFYWPE